MQIALRRFTIANGDIHAALLEVHTLDAGMQSQIDGGKLRFKFRQAWYQPMR
ncbi:hypothetical protein ETAR_26090 [Edwardsiella tarda]